MIFSGADDTTWKLVIQLLAPLKIRLFKYSAINVHNQQMHRAPLWMTSLIIHAALDVQEQEEQISYLVDSWQFNPVHNKA